MRRRDRKEGQAIAGCVLTRVCRPLRVSGAVLSFSTRTLGEAACSVAGAAAGSAGALGPIRGCRAVWCEGPLRAARRPTATQLPAAQLCPLSARISLAA
jgi:hypothetical protein